jgi:hypothetical protein
VTRMSGSLMAPEKTEAPGRAAPGLLMR